MVLGPLKEIYLTALTIFYRASSSQWPVGFNLGKGVAGVALIQAPFLASVASCIDIFTGKHLCRTFPSGVSSLVFCLFAASIITCWSVEVMVLILNGNSPI
jgi:hypothetical protein